MPAVYVVTGTLFGEGVYEYSIIDWIDLRVGMDVRNRRVGRNGKALEAHQRRSRKRRRPRGGGVGGGGGGEEEQRPRGRGETA